MLGVSGHNLLVSDQGRPTDQEYIADSTVVVISYVDPVRIQFIVLRPGIGP